MLSRPAFVAPVTLAFALAATACKHSSDGGSRGEAVTSISGPLSFAGDTGDTGHPSRVSVTYAPDPADTVNRVLTYTVLTPDVSVDTTSTFGSMASDYTVNTTWTDSPGGNRVYAFDALGSSGQQDAVFPYIIDSFDPGMSSDGLKAIYNSGLRLNELAKILSKALTDQAQAGNVTTIKALQTVVADLQKICTPFYNSAKKVLANRGFKIPQDAPTDARSGSGDGQTTDPKGTGDRPKAGGGR